MKGSDVRELRRQAGMSQVVFAAAIGVSRETIGRMERGTEDIDRRTELAMRYVAENGPLETRDLREIHQSVAEILDQTAVQGRATTDSTRRLRATADEWAAARGSAAGAGLLMSAQGTIGMLNVTGEHDPFRARVFEELRQLKLAWRALSNDVTPE